MSEPAPPQGRRRRLLAPLEHLQQNPARFRFGAAVRLLWLASGRRDAAEAIRFTAPVSLAHPAAEVDQAGLSGGGVDHAGLSAGGVDQAGLSAGGIARGLLSTRLIGLVGGSSPLPRWYTELVASASRARAPAMAAFLELLAQRLVGGFAAAGIKYRPHLAAEIAARTAAAADATDPDPAGRVLLGLTGFATEGIVGRLAAGIDPVRHYAGFFATRPRSADRLQAMLSDWLERPVVIDEFAGAWLRIEPDSQSRMPRGRIPGQFNRLGVDCAAGARAYDQQARFVIRIGPLSRAAFMALLPDRPQLHRLVSLVRAYVGMEVDFTVNLVLDPAGIPPVRLGGADAPRLSWSGWLPAPAARLTGGMRADQAMFAASVIEALPMPAAPPANTP